MYVCYKYIFPSELYYMRTTYDDNGANRIWILIKKIRTTKSINCPVCVKKKNKKLVMPSIPKRLSRGIMTYIHSLLTLL